LCRSRKRAHARGETHLADVELRDLDNSSIRVSREGKQGFSPKDYEERLIPISRELAEVLGQKQTLGDRFGNQLIAPV
jgi:hypothetical protein